MTIAHGRGHGVLIPAVGSLVGLVLQRNFQGQPTHDQASHAPQPPEMLNREGSMIPRRRRA